MRNPTMAGTSKKKLFKKKGKAQAKEQVGPLPKRKLAGSAALAAELETASQAITESALESLFKSVRKLKGHLGD